MIVPFFVACVISAKNMKISVTAKVRAKKEYVKKTGEREYTVAVSAAPEKGKANAAIAAGIAAYFDVAQSRVRLVAGAGAKQKIFEIS